MTNSIILRAATIKDADILLEWRNDPETRKTSHNTTEVLRTDHISWLADTLTNPNRILYIAEYHRTPVGTIRADLSNGIWELSWTVSPKARGRGVAKGMISVLSDQISEPIRAEVKAGNIASTRIAEHAGMVFEYEASGILHYKRAALDKRKT